MTDPGLHFRGVLYTAQISQWTRCAVQLYTVPLETPEASGRVEHHGGIVKAMYKTQCQGIEQVHTNAVLNEVCIASRILLHAIQVFHHPNGY